MSQQMHMVAPAEKDRHGCIWYGALPGVSVMIAFEPMPRTAPVTLHRMKAREVDGD